MRKRTVIAVLCLGLPCLAAVSGPAAAGNRKDEPAERKPTALRVRKNALTLTKEEKAAFVKAVLELKRRGVWDRFVQMHLDAMTHATPADNETPNAAVRNAAHRGPAVLPWHRHYLNLLELELQKVDPSVTIPYWDWTAELPDPTKSPIWAPDFLGGGGTKANDWRVGDGPFAHAAGKWEVTVPREFGGAKVPPYLQRGFGQFKDPLGIVAHTLPTKKDLELALNQPLYDVFPWNSASPGGFRLAWEGWYLRHLDPQNIKHPGVQLHARVHIWVGGTMTAAYSPNDPSFFLHHAFVDRGWVLWENHQRRTNKALAPGEILYLPRSGGPKGHNLRDAMFPFLDPPVRPIDVLDHHRMGYRYDDETPPVMAPGAHHHH